MPEKSGPIIPACGSWFVAEGRLCRCTRTPHGEKEVHGTSDGPVASPFRFGGEFNTDVLCTLPGCDSPLYLELAGSICLGVPSAQWPNGGTGESPDFNEMHTTTWKVVCENGHVVCTPPDTAEDHATYFKMSEFLAQGFINWPEVEDG